MNDLNRLVFAAKDRLDKTSNSSGLVGNRMHFPMLINYYGERTAAILDKMTESFDRIWPQTSENIIYVHSSLTGNNDVALSELSDGAMADVTLDELHLQSMIDSIRLKRGIFASMLKWCIFNIIETSSISSISEFESIYNSIDKIKNTVDGTTSTMLVVLLDESSSKKVVASLIREYLSKNSAYDGVIVISNKTIKSELYSFDELNDIVAGVIILSNNDIISSFDDNYDRRISCLFGGRTLTLAYSSLRRPNVKISTQMLNLIIEQIYNKQIDWPLLLSESELSGRLGLENGKISFIEERLKLMDVRFPVNDISLLPLRSIPNSEIDINSITYSAYSEYMCSGAFESYLDSFLKSKADGAINIKSTLDEYTSMVKNNLTSSEIVGLSETTIDNLVSRIQVQAPNKGLALSDYFKNYVKYYTKKNIVIPYIKEMLLNLSKLANKTIDAFRQFREDYVRVLPLDGFSELGTMYSTLTENYLQTSDGELMVCKTVAPGNGCNEFESTLLHIFDDIISKNRDVFSLTFIREWEERLNLAGDEVYKRIQATFERDFEQKLFLFGNYQRTRIPLEVYMCHTTDSNGQNATDLYNHLKNAVGVVDRAQFVNTGLDDVVEAFRFIDCSGSNLLL